MSRKNCKEWELNDFIENDNPKSTNTSSVASKLPCEGSSRTSFLEGARDLPRRLDRCECKKETVM
jgi:hypothetical protein